MLRSLFSFDLKHHAPTLELAIRADSVVLGMGGRPSALTGRLRVRHDGDHASAGQAGESFPLLTGFPKGFQKGQADCRVWPSWRLDCGRFHGGEPSWKTRGW